MLNTKLNNQKLLSNTSVYGSQRFYNPFRIPAKISSSALMKQGGFQVYSGIVDEKIRKNLLSEAVEQSRFATECDVRKPDREEIRGGMPRRKFLTSPGGAYQEALYNAGWLLEFLRAITTETLRPTGQKATFSYYARKGDFLDIHRDIITCDVAVISCLQNTCDTNKIGGQLCLYPQRIEEKLSTIRQTPEKGAMKIMLEEGNTLVMYGGIIPHALLPVTADQVRIISVLCYDAS